MCGVYRRNNWQKKQKNYGRYEKKKDAEKHLIEIKSTVNNNKLLTLVLCHIFICKCCYSNIFMSFLYAFVS
ncbi:MULTISPECIES: Arm DNA-binding domain-containing protein [unclassified Clostridioides]|uniref:Arm DNA-binding domain-containing protein n=1 Tax=Clostridioides sp. ES-S-0171-01 TaxID=2770785 RepID=UPI001D1219CB